MSNNNNNKGKNMNTNVNTTTTGGVVHMGPKSYSYDWDSIVRFITRQLTKDCAKAQILVQAMPNSDSLIKPIRLAATGIEAKEREDTMKYNGVDDVIDSSIVTVKNDKVLKSWLYTEENIDTLQQLVDSGSRALRQRELDHIKEYCEPQYLDQKVIYTCLNPVSVLRSMWSADNPDVCMDEMIIRITKTKTKIKDRCVKTNYTIEVRNKNDKKKNHNDKSDLKRIMGLTY